MSRGAEAFIFAITGETRSILLCVLRPNSSLFNTFRRDGSKASSAIWETGSHQPLALSIPREGLLLLFTAFTYIEMESTPVIVRFNGPPLLSHPPRRRYSIHTPLEDIQSWNDVSSSRPREP